ncbi:MAG: hypothetical protein ACE15C_20785 [Phycisphaerae bacterium]
MPVITDIADAVAAELNGNDFGTPLAAVRSTKPPEFELADMKDLRVTVVPRGWDSQTATRAAAQCDYQIDIGVQKKVASGDNPELDALVGLVERIADHFRTHRLTAMPSAVWVRNENVPLYAPEHMKELRQFTSVLTLTFRVLR